MKAGDDLAGVARQRSHLGRAMHQVELAAAAPAAKDSWVIDLQHSLRQLEIAFNDHMVEAQSPLGLLDRIVDQAPRLQRSVEGMRSEQAMIAEALTGTLSMLEEEGATERHDQIRDAVLALLLSLSRHRQKVADLVYDAWDVDIGGY